MKEERERDFKSGKGNQEEEMRKGDEGGRRREKGKK